MAANFDACALLVALGSVGLHARAAIAGSWGAAHARARFMARPGYVSAPGKARAMSLLFPSPPCVSRRIWLGAAARCLSASATCGATRAPLTQRFGPELGRRLNQATGRSPSRSSHTSGGIDRGPAAFGEPIGAAETIVRYVGKLVDQLCLSLQRKGLGAGCLI